MFKCSNVAEEDEEDPRRMQQQQQQQQRQQQGHAAGGRNGVGGNSGNGLHSQPRQQQQQQQQQRGLQPGSGREIGRTASVGHQRVEDEQLVLEGPGMHSHGSTPALHGPDRNEAGAEWGCRGARMNVGCTVSPFSVMRLHAQNADRVTV
jgi:hypothetical protein